jgi:hypothetical protein
MKTFTYSSLLCVYSSMIVCMLSILKGYANSPPYCHHQNPLATIISWLSILVNEWDSVLSQRSQMAKFCGKAIYTPSHTPFCVFVDALQSCLTSSCESSQSTLCGICVKSEIYFGLESDIWMLWACVSTCVRNMDPNKSPLILVVEWQHNH